MEIRELLNKCAEIGVKREAIAERAGTSAAVIGHYRTGYRKPSEKSADNIRKAIKTIGEELLIINLD